jgi:hypothetical protein
LKFNAEAARSTDVSQRPGVIYYCESKDLQEVWVTMTRLLRVINNLAFSPDAGGVRSAACAREVLSATHVFYNFLQSFAVA